MASAPPAPDSAVATIENINSGVIDVKELAGRGDVVRVEVVVSLPASFQYVIPARKKVGREWMDDPANSKVGITSDGYDYLNRYLGVSFFTPEFVPDDKGDLVRNPIHRQSDGYIFERMGATWYNEAGQLVAAFEDLEVNPAALYAAARVDSFSAVPVLDEQGLPTFDQFGFPVVVMRGDDAMKEDRKALKELMKSRTMGLRYAQTVLRVRLIKVALGVKSLPGGVAKDRKVRVVGFRDKFDPIARQAAAEAAMQEMFGGAAPRADETPLLTSAEVADIEGGPDAEREAIESLASTGAGTSDDGGEEFDFPR